MLRLLRYGEIGQRPRLADIHNALPARPPFTKSPVIFSFLDGLAAHAKFYTADDLIIGAIPSTLWKAGTDEQHLRLLIDTALRSQPQLLTLPNSLAERDTYRGILRAAPKTLPLLAIGSALARRCRGAREHAWWLGFEIASLHATLGTNETRGYLDSLLSRLEETRQRLCVNRINQAA